MSKFLSSRFAGMQPYVPGEQPQGRQYIKLNTNESPFPPAPGVLSALSREEIARLNLYPDPDAREAGAAIAAYYGLQGDEVLLTNGSDEALAFCFQAYCDADTPAVYADITYGFYKVFARIYCVPSKVIPLTPRLEIDPEAYRDAGGTVFLANPNAPTGLALPLEQVEWILKHNRENIVVVDEAYVDFGGKSALPLLKKHDNLIIVQTMSKARNLAGARLGYALSNPALIADLNNMRFSFNPYNVNRLSLLAGAAAIRDEAYFRQCTAAIMENRAYTAEELRRRGFAVLESKANFLFAKPDRLSGEAYYAALKGKGVLVRHFAQPRIADYVRVSIGTREQMQALLGATDEIWREL